MGNVERFVFRIRILEGRLDEGKDETKVIDLEPNHNHHAVTLTTSNYAHVASTRAVEYSV